MVSLELLTMSMARLLQLWAWICSLGMFESLTRSLIRTNCEVSRCSVKAVPCTTWQLRPYLSVEVQDGIYTKRRISSLSGYVDEKRHLSLERKCLDSLPVTRSVFGEIEIESICLECICK